MNYHIKTNNGLNFSKEIEISKLIIKKSNYKRLDKKYSEELANKFNTSTNVIESIYANYINDKQIFRFGKIKSQIKEIFELYNNKLNILQLVEKYDHPAFSLLRLILTEKKCGKDVIKKALKNLTGDNKCITDNDIKQIEIAYQIDDFTNPNQDKTLENSLKFERMVQDVIESNKIDFFTQDDLIKQQKTDDGKVTNTPDFLLKQKIKINGKEINWIEVKNFYGTFTYNVKSKINEQISRYYKKWGSGCLIFNLGFCDRLGSFLKRENDVIICSFDDFKDMKKLN